MEEQKYKLKFGSVEELLEEKKPKTVGLLSTWYKSEGLWTLDKDIALLCEFRGIEMGHLWLGPESFPRKDPLLREHRGPGFDLVIVEYECPCAGGGLLVPEYGQEIKEKGITDQVYYAARMGIGCLDYIGSSQECGEGKERIQKRLQMKEELIHLLEECGVGISKKMEERVSRLDKELTEQVGRKIRELRYSIHRSIEDEFPVPETKCYGF